MQSHNNPLKLFTVKIIFKRELWVYFNIFDIIWTRIFKIRPERFLNDPVRGPDCLVQWGLEVTLYYHIPKHKNTFSVHSSLLRLQLILFLYKFMFYYFTFWGKKKTLSNHSLNYFLSKNHKFSVSNLLVMLVTFHKTYITEKKLHRNMWIQASSTFL